MKKYPVFFICAILIISFAGLVYYGLKHSKGIPATVEKSEKIILEVPFIDRDMNLIKGISSEIWNILPSKEIKLMYQITVLPWPKAGAVSEIIVKAFHNKKNIYFYMNWRDDTEDITIEPNKFSDACAIMFPLGKEVQPHTIMMGFLGKSNIWQWKANQDREYWTKKEQEMITYSDLYYPFEKEEIFPVSKVISKSAVNDLIAIRVGTITLKENQNVQGRGIFKDGIWKVIFKRSLDIINSEFDASFSSKKRLCAFAVWNGSKGDRGGRKSISDWVELEL